MSTPAYVQSAALSEGPGSFTTVSKAFTSPQTAGNCNVICMFFQCSSGSAILPVTITDTAGNTYQQVCPTGSYPVSAVYAAQTQIYIAYVAFNIAASTANTLAMTFGGTYQFVSVLMAEYSGATCLGSVDGNPSVQSATSGTAITSPSITPKGANELLVTYATSSATGGTVTPAIGWTKRVNSGFADGIADQLSVSGSYTGAWTSSASATWGCITFALAAPPVIMSPAGGLWDQPQVVTLSTSLPSATIYYTTDGATPGTSSNQYVTPFVVSSTATVSAYAVNSVPTNSAVASYAFNVPANIVPTNIGIDYSTGKPLLPMSGHIMYDTPSGYWYWYGATYTGPSVFLDGAQGVYCYVSTDLRNWKFASTIVPPASNANRWTRVRVIYNVANNNYVLWMNAGFATLYRVMAATSPTGPFTQIVDYGSLDGFATTGDFNLFVDVDGVSAYMLRTGDSTNGHIGITKLNSTYTNTDGVNQVYYVNTGSGPFGKQSEGHAMANVNGVYFWMASGFTIWAPNSNRYTYSTTGPLGPWTNGATNPFQPVSGGVPDFNTSFDTQTNQIISIPGRNAFIYNGDRYDTGLTSSQLTSTTANFSAYRSIFLPITFPTSTSAAITWQPAWNFDTVFPTVSGAPSPATSLNYSGGAFSWTNHETKAANVYLDYSTDSTFSPVTRSEIVSVNTAPVTSWTPVVPVSAGFYRIRTVNASGVSVSVVFSNSLAAVTVQSASGVTKTTATLNATVTSSGSGNVTQEGFNYGLTIAYGSQVFTNGTFGPNAFSKALAGLSPGQVYHYQAFATNASGTSTSTDAIFTTISASGGGGTPVPPPIVPPVAPPPPRGFGVLSNITALVGNELWVNNGSFQFSFDSHPNTVLDVLQQLYNLWSVPLGSQVNQRAFGTDMSWIDLPGNIATLQAQTAFLLSAAKWVPQCSFSKIQFSVNTIGILAGQYSLYCELTIDLTSKINTQILGPPSATPVWVLNNAMEGVYPDVELDNVTI